MRALGLGLAVVIGMAGAAEARAEVVAKPRRQPWLGVSLADRTSWGGVAIADVFEDTPASLCGLRRGDEIVAIDTMSVRSYEELKAAVSLRDVGDAVKVGYVRDGDPHRCTAKLAEQITDQNELLHRRFIDKPVPAFSVERRGDGITLDDATLRGHVYALVLFSTACDGCASTIADLQGRLGADVSVLAVTADGAAALDAYVNRMGVTADVAVDEGELVQRAQFRRDEPTILVVDHRGVVRFASLGAGADGTSLDGAAYCAERAERARRKSS